MLRQLHIQNYAIIEEISFRLDPHLSVVTGETGAGKSIIAGALSLVLGDRADTGVLMNREKKCVVEAAFLVEQKKEIEQFLQSHDLDHEQELTIRRGDQSEWKIPRFHQRYTGKPGTGPPPECFACGPPSAV